MGRSLVHSDWRASNVILYTPNLAGRVLVASPFLFLFSLRGFLEEG